MLKKKLLEVSGGQFHLSPTGLAMVLK